MTCKGGPSSFHVFPTPQCGLQPAPSSRHSSAAKQIEYEHSTDPSEPFGIHCEEQMNTSCASDSRTTVLSTLKQLVARRLLVAAINTLYIPALAHQKNGIATGSLVFQRLYHEAEIYVNRHAERWCVAVTDLYAVIPALEHLRVLADANEHFE
jgi:hypothetical protein